MRIKLKICGIKSLQNAIEVSKLSVDLIGFVAEPTSPRYVPEEVIEEAKEIIKTPIVYVRASGPIEVMIKTSANFIQIHRILEDKELETLKTYNRKFILYVPASLNYINYLKKVQKYSDLILFDSPIKGSRSDPRVLRVLLDYHPDAGVAGGITVDNVHEYLELEPGWIDVSSSVEVSPGVKDLNKVRILKEVVHSWKRKT